ncbi:MAG: hypothetical protein A2776_00670 [Candidatus Levybacteria bacterium RIFCSPHIGHO2_01_FULL_40_10]|nr:MAG: hypothetical protein A2776_00670 [Candidatus Levybacteria bacterium RIFCSPHIGHO2_01_FULL_40_10]
MFSQQDTGSTNSLLNKLKLLIPRKPLHAAIFLELLIVLSIGGSSYAVLSVTDKMTLKPKPEKASIAKQEEPLLPTLSPTNPPAGGPPVTPKATISIPAATPTSVPTPIPTVNPTSEWLTFTGTKYSYSIKYQPNWGTTDRGILEPSIPTYIVFNPPNASSSARAVVVYVTTRTYQEQLALGSANGSGVTIAGIAGTQQELRDSNGIETTRIILPSSAWLYVLEGKKSNIATFNQMLQTFKVLK